jgi:diguanylate cyclase (GGDEF)-like protein
MPELPRVLAVDDDPHTRALLRDLLGGMNLRCEVAETGEAGLARIFAEPPDLLLLDLSLPGIDGFEVLQRVRADARTAALPVILLTATGELDAKIRGLELGALDYLVKPFAVHELTARVGMALELIRTRERLRETEDQLAAARGLEPVSGAGTLAQLRDALEQEMARARRYGKPVSVLLLALEGLETLAAGRTREAARRAVADVAETLRRALRDCDRLFRVDVEEFLVVLPETDPAGAAACGRRLRIRLAAAEGAPESLRVAVGTATFPDDGVASPEDLLRKANERLSIPRA